MKKTLLLVLLCITYMATATAQSKDIKAMLTKTDHTSWRGMRFSYNHSNMRYSGGDEVFKFGYNGFSLGYVQAFSIAKKLPLFIEAGAGIDFMRHSFDGSEGDMTDKYSINILALDIPVNVVYKVKLTNKINIKPYTGIYLRLNMLAKEKDEIGGNSETFKEDYNLFDGDDGWKRVQLGWQIGAMADYSRYSIGLGYSIDFNEITESCKFGTLSVRLGYNF